MTVDVSVDYYGLYRCLYERYGPQHWWPGETRFEIAIGAILTQNTSWRNVEKAIHNLKEAGALGYAALALASTSQLEIWLRPCGYYRLKTRRVQAFLAHLGKHHAGSMARLLDQPIDATRSELLTIWGIGPETADSILLYAGSHATFVVDAYTYRLLTRLGWWEGRYDYEAMRTRFMEAFPPEPRLFNEYHALIVRHAHEHCHKTPECSGCPLRTHCSYLRDSEVR